METKIVEEKFFQNKDGCELFQISQKLVMYDVEKRKFLVVKFVNEEGFCAKRYGAWDLPGGKVDREDVSLEQALSREVSEEIGDVEYELIGTLGLQLAEYSQGKTVLVGYLAQYDSGDIVLSSEHTEYRWIAPEDADDGSYGPFIKNFLASAAERIKEREYLNDVKRISADFENYKRRQEERMKELVAMSVERVALDMIPVLDNFRAAEMHVPEGEKAGAWMTGITYIGKQLEETLANHGLVRYEAKVGDVFDPALHEAVSQEKGEGEEGTIVKSLQPGYTIGTRVVRPAKVVVA